MPKLALLFLLIFIGCNKTTNSADDPVKYHFSSTVSPSEAGTISPEDGEYEEGTTLTIEATPNDGYSFWEWSGDVTGYENPISVELSNDLNLEAIFNTYEESVTYRYEGYNGNQGKVENASFGLMNYLPGPIGIVGYTLLDENGSEVDSVNSDMVGASISSEDTEYFSIDFYEIMNDRGYDALPDAAPFSAYTLILDLEYSETPFAEENIISVSEDFLR